MTIGRPPCGSRDSLAVNTRDRDRAADQCFELALPEHVADGRTVDSALCAS